MVSCNCNKPYKSRDKWVVALMAGLLFMLFASPFFFAALNSGTSRFGLEVANIAGCPNLGGVVLSAVLYMFLVRLLMR